MKTGRLARRIFQSIAIFAVLGGPALLFLVWLEHRTEFTLPAPTGPFAVGRVLYDWVDREKLDPLAAVPGTKRELLVWIWYPAAGPSAATEVYLPLQLRTAVERERPAIMSKLLTRDLSKVHAHGIWNSAVSPQQRSYPVLIMRGGGSAEVWNYSTLAEDLASHGYVVVGFDAPYRTSVVAFPDGRVVTRLPANNPELCEGMTYPDLVGCVNPLLNASTSDTAFVLNQLEQLNRSDAAHMFTGRLDMTRVGVFGHSFGGAAALQFCKEDPRCKTGIDVDGAPFGSVVQTGLDRPFMIIVSDHSHESDPAVPQIMANLQSIYDRLPANERLYVSIRGANHFLFSDDGALLKSHIALRTLRAVGVVGIDGRRQLAVTAYCLRTFFDACLKKESASRITIASPLYPELKVRE
jgi:predicted dienelactone hydrolase